MRPNGTRGIYFILFTIFIFISGCGGVKTSKSDGSCLKDQDCKLGEICQDQQCRKSCQEDKECESGEKCLEGGCQKVTLCQNDQDCPEGQVCLEEVCQAAGEKCKKDQDCQEGMICKDGDCH